MMPGVVVTVACRDGQNASPTGTADCRLADPASPQFKPTVFY